jgi:hypothetical protein
MINSDVSDRFPPAIWHPKSKTPFPPRDPNSPKDGRCFEAECDRLSQIVRRKKKTASRRPFSMSIETRSGGDGRHLVPAIADEAETGKASDDNHSFGVVTGKGGAAA